MHHMNLEQLSLSLSLSLSLGLSMGLGLSLSLRLRLSVGGLLSEFILPSSNTRRFVSMLKCRKV